MKQLFVLLVVLILALPLAGCYDYNEPDEIAWVLAIGMDKGKENKLMVTAIIAVPKNIAAGGGDAGGGGDGGSKTFLSVSLEVPSLLSALELLDAVVDRRPNLSHTTWFVFSRELAEEGIEPYFAPLARFYQFRRSASIIICEGQAQEFLSQGKPELENNVSKYYQQLMQQGWQFSEFIPADTLHQFYIKSKISGVAALAVLAALKSEEPASQLPPQDGGQVNEELPDIPKGEYQAGQIPRQGAGNIELMGAAVFRQGRMIGILNGDELGAARMLEGTLKRTIKDIPDPAQPDTYLICDVKPRQKPRVRVEIGPDYPRINIDLAFEGDLLSIQSGINYENPHMLHLAEQAITQSLQEDINTYLAKSQQLGVDVAGLGLSAKKCFRTWPEWEAYDWESKYPLATIAVSVDYKLRRIGLLRETVPLR